MNDSTERVPGSETVSPQASDTGTAVTPTKKRLLEEYQDNVGGGGFHAWLSWAYSF